LKFENFLASRILSYKRYKNSVSSPIIKISIFSIIIAVTVINFSVSIGFGIQNEIKNKFSLISGDFYVSNFKNENFSTFYPIDLNEINFLKLKNNFDYVNKVIYNPGIIPIKNNFQEVVFKGIESSNINFLNSFIKDSGKIQIKNNEIIISEKLSNKLNINLQDNVKFLFFKNENSKIPIVRKFNVVGLYNSSISEFDSRVVIGNIEQSLSINKWDNNYVGALELSLKNKNDSMKSIDLLYSSIPSSYDIQQSSDRFPEIYSWINLFDTNIYLIITLMIIVGGINMITALLVTVLNKTKLIASLKVLGSNNNSIKKIFMINGFYLILRGVILGNLISLSLMLLQKYFMIIKLDPNTYYSDYVPIEIDPFNLFLTNLIVVVISLAMLIIPSNVISKIKPNSTFKLS